MRDRGHVEAKRHGMARSPHWSAFRDAFMATHPRCAVCGTTAGLQAHHILPFHYVKALGRGDLELDERNLVALCEGPGTYDHHLELGHLGNFRSGSLIRPADLGDFKSLARLRAMRLPPLDELGSTQTKLLRKFMREHLPRAKR